MKQLPRQSPPIIHTHCKFVPPASPTSIYMGQAYVEINAESVGNQIELLSAFCMGIHHKSIRRHLVTGESEQIF